MKLLVPSISVLETDGFRSDLDIFNREPYGKSLMNLIKNSDDELVIGLDSAWGEGKSTFIKMWQGMLTQNSIPYVYFDAFENDFISDPFLAITSKIYSLIETGDTNTHKKFLNKATKALKVIGKAGLNVGIKAGTAGILDATIFKGNEDLIDDASEEVSDLVDDYLAKKIADANKDKKNIESFKTYLTELGSELSPNGNVVFIIDELDRCKPKFALSLLESIKHLFSVPKITFLLVMNRDQLEESIKCEYGQGVDSTRYLQKFINVWTSLPKSDDMTNSIQDKYLINCLKRMEFKVQTVSQSNTVKTYKELANYYKLSLRDIERSLSNFAVVYNVTDGDLNHEQSIITVFLSIIKVTKPKLFRRLANKTITYEEVLKEACLEELNAKNFWKNGDQGHFLRWLLWYVLSPDETRVSEVENQSNLNYLEDRVYAPFIIENVSKWMDAFHRY